MAIRQRPSVCPEFVDRLVDLSDGELSVDERLTVSTHVAVCSGCRMGLAQLDSSRDRLLNGISSKRVELPRAPLVSGRSLKWASRAAAIGLIFVTTLWVVRLRTFSPKLTGVAPSPAPVETIAVPKLSHHDALWQIALVEQQARLQTSLDLWPKDESYDEQRDRNRRLMATFQSLTDASLTGSVP